MFFNKNVLQLCTKSYLFCKQTYTTYSFWITPHCYRCSHARIWINRTIVTDKISLFSVTRVRTGSTAVSTTETLWTVSCSWQTSDPIQSIMSESKLISSQETWRYNLIIGSTAYQYLTNKFFMNFSRCRHPWTFVFSFGKATQLSCTNVK